MDLSPALSTELGDEAQRIEEDALYSGKGHYNCVSPWRWAHRVLGMLSAVGSALAGTSALKQWSPALTIGAAATSALAAVVLTTLKPSEEADRHQRAGDR